MTVERNPRTEAGRGLLADIMQDGGAILLDDGLACILAIEAEASAEPGAHSCANHDETLDEAYRKGFADALADWNDRLEAEHPIGTGHD